MSIFKRAWVYIIRKRTRSIILFVLFFVMALFLLVGISVYSSAREEAEKVKKSLPAGINIQMIYMDVNDRFDFKKTETGALERTLKVPLLTESTFQKILKIDGITGYDEDVDIIGLYTGLKVRRGNSYVYLEELKAKDPATLTTEEKGNIEHCETAIYENGFYPTVEGKVTPFFKNGAIEICEGRNIEKDDKRKAVISEELAQRNQLKVGDKITASLYGMIGELYGEKFELEIVGIFHMNFEEKVKEEITGESQILSNLIFTDKDEITQWHDREWSKYNNAPDIVPLEDPLVSGVTLYVKDPEKLKSIEEEMKEVGDNVDWSNYNITYDDKDYKAVAKPLIQMITLSVILMAIMGVGALVILSLVLSMWIQSRKREIRILSLIGIKKKSIVAQFVLECSILAVMAFILAGVLAGPVTNMTGEAWSTFASKNQSDQPYEASVNERLNVEVHIVANEPVALQYHLTWQMMILVFAVMLFVSVIAVIISYVRIGGHRAREIGL